jgi:small GTP-binding protein
MAEKTLRKSAKICLFGESSVGKTSLIRRFVDDKYDDKYITTIGTKVSKKKLTVESPTKSDTEIEFVLMVWDIMGQKGFRHLLQESYFDGATGAIGVCDITRKETLDELKGWMESIIKVCGDVPIILIGNKADLTEQAVVSIDDIKDVAVRYIESGWREDLKDFIDNGMPPYLMASAKTGENVDEAFKRVAKMIL